MKLIVGLGNPGDKYAKTRHNLGFIALEHFFKDFKDSDHTVWENSEKFKSDIAIFDYTTSHSYEKIILAKPKTYMNLSGMAVSLIQNFYKIDADDIWIIHDDIDLPLGSLRIRQGGGAGGHKGIESIIESLNASDFWRFRLGIGRPGTSTKETVAHAVHKDIDDYVLGKFTAHEHSKIRELLSRTVHALNDALEKDLHTSQHKWNTK